MFVISSPVPERVMFLHTALGAKYGFASFFVAENWVLVVKDCMTVDTN